MNAQHRINKIDNKLRKLDKRIQWLENTNDKQQFIELQRLRNIFVKTMQRKEALSSS